MSIPASSAAGTAGHTRTPWFACITPNGLEIYQDDGSGYGDHIDVRGDSSVAHRNAAFIVRACNNHDALVAALRELRRDWLQLSKSGDGSDLGKRVLAALVQAEGRS